MHQFPWKISLGTALSAALTAACLTCVPAAAEGPAGAGSSPVVINEAYLSGGSSGAAYKNKFVELYNTSDTPVPLEGWSVQYRSARGTAAPTSVAALSGSIPAKGHYLVQGGSNGANGADLPAPDLIATALNFSGSAGTIVLAKQTTAVALGTGSQIETAGVSDLLGYGGSNTFETQAATAPSGNTDVKSLNRAGGTDSNNNAADFSLNSSITPTGTGATAPDPGPAPAPDPALRTIAEIQGTGKESPLTGSTVTTTGKVTAVFPTGGLNGYYLQTAGTGGDLTATRSASDGIFVYSPSTVAAIRTGDHVQVTGTVTEYYGMTQLNVTSSAGLAPLTEPAPEVKPTAFTLPANETFRESLEGMLLAPQGPMTVTDNYSLNQYGEIGLAGGTAPLVQPTAVAPYGSAEHAAVVAGNAARGIKLDDGASTNFLRDAATKSQAVPYLTATDPVRVGSPATFTTNVVLGYANSSWKLQPLTHLTEANKPTAQPATFGATRTAAPSGGQRKDRLLQRPELLPHHR